MKDDKVVLIICILISISMLTGIVLMLNVPLDTEIMYESWYSYNPNTGQYDELYIKDGSIEYNSNENNNCKEYTYKSINKTIYLDCGTNIKIKRIRQNYLLLEINGENKLFFKTLDETFNKEFYDYYGMSVSEYTESKKYVEDATKLNQSEIINYVNEESIFVFKGNSCISIECTLIDNILEYYMVNNNNTFYIDSSNLNSNYLNNIEVEDFIKDSNYYNSEYPIIMIIKDNKATYIDFKCNGLNCNYYKKYSQK